MVCLEDLSTLLSLQNTRRARPPPALPAPLAPAPRARRCRSCGPGRSRSGTGARMRDLRGKVSNCFPAGERWKTGHVSKTGQQGVFSGVVLQDQRSTSLSRPRICKPSLLVARCIATRSKELHGAVAGTALASCEGPRGRTSRRSCAVAGKTVKGGEEKRKVV